MPEIAATNVRMSGEKLERQLSSGRGEVQGLRRSVRNFGEPLGIAGGGGGGRNTISAVSATAEDASRLLCLKTEEQWKSKA